MTLDPARPEKNRRGVWGGVAPQWVWVSGCARRPGPGPPAIPGPGPPAIPGITRPGSKKGYGFGFGIGFWVWVIFPGVPKYRKIRFPIFPGVQKYRKTEISNISRILENVADFNFQYFQAGNN